jgi:hypothetical protein
LLLLRSCHCCSLPQLSLLSLLATIALTKYACAAATSASAGCAQAAPCSSLVATHPHTAVAGDSCVSAPPASAVGVSGSGRPSKWTTTSAWDRCPLPASCLLLPALPLPLLPGWPQPLQLLWRMGQLRTLCRLL